mmetsp:Transcript_178790/g.573033  ORF Transcript_178790/g.573033 Transcript_178790/m.573033 type:complete len:292 (+) Transcript_178790:174-1049(+)
MTEAVGSSIDPTDVPQEVAADCAPVAVSTSEVARRRLRRREGRRGDGPAPAVGRLDVRASATALHKGMQLCETIVDVLHHGGEIFASIQLPPEQLQQLARDRDVAVARGAAALWPDEVRDHARDQRGRHHAGVALVEQRGERREVRQGAPAVEGVFAIGRRPQLQALVPLQLAALAHDGGALACQQVLDGREEVVEELENVVRLSSEEARHERIQLLREHLQVPCKARAPRSSLDVEEGETNRDIRPSRLILNTLSLMLRQHRGPLSKDRRLRAHAGPHLCRATPRGRRRL